MKNSAACTQTEASKLNPRPRKKAQHKAKAKAKQESPLIEVKQGYHHQGNIKMLNYFEEIKFNGGSHLVDMHEITEDLVCLPATQ
jgi:hypothetical protein